MKIYQGYESKAMQKFEFLKRFNLKHYRRTDMPLVVFGFYKKEDFHIVRKHHGPVVIMWGGADVKNRNRVYHRNVTNVTCLPAVQEYLNNKKHECFLIKQVTMEKPNPLVLGRKVYAYVNKGKPEYHGSLLIDRLNLNGELLIGDHSISRQDWYTGESDKMYSQSYIGLALSEFAGGGDTIMEMGLRGIRVVTNVLRMPHTIPWKTIKDIKESIDYETIRIGAINIDLAEEVYSKVEHDMDCFNLERLIIR